MDVISYLAYSIKDVPYHNCAKSFSLCKKFMSSLAVIGSYCVCSDLQYCIGMVESKENTNHTFRETPIKASVK